MHEPHHGVLALTIKQGILLSLKLDPTPFWFLNSILSRGENVNSVKMACRQRWECFGNQHSHGMLSIHFYPHMKKLQRKIQRRRQFLPTNHFPSLFNWNPRTLTPFNSAWIPRKFQQHTYLIPAAFLTSTPQCTRHKRALGYIQRLPIFLSLNPHSSNGQRTSTQIPTLCYFIITQLAQDAQEHHHRAWTHTNLQLTS